MWLVWRIRGNLVVVLGGDGEFRIRPLLIAVGMLCGATMAMLLHLVVQEILTHFLLCDPD